MKTVLIPENADDLKVVDDMNDQWCEREDDPKRKNTSLEAVALVPNTEGGWAKWTVVDNRGHQAFSEDFATLDGAMVYASDIRTTCEHQEDWDRDGMFYGMLRRTIVSGRKMKRDVMERWDGKDHEGLVSLFVESILANVNGLHTVRYLTEDHDTGGGEVESDCLVEITFTNATGAMGEIDHALESMNGLDFRRVCDKFLKLSLERHGLNADVFGWPTPDVRVTRDWYEDDDDVTKTVTLVWQVDPETWETLVKHKEKGK